MNNGGEAADQMVRQSLQFAEVAIKLTALGFKNALSMALAYAKERPKVRGRTRLDRLLREGRELPVIPIQTKGLKEFTQQAKHYGVLFAPIRDKQGQGEKLDIMFRAEDVSKLNRIYERMGYAIPQQTRQGRKKALTRHPQDSNLRMRGELEAKADSRPSVRTAIIELKKAALAAQKAREQARDAITPDRGER